MAEKRKSSKSKVNVEVVKVGSNNYVLFRPSDVYPGLRDKTALHIGSLDNHKVFHPSGAYFELTKDYLEALVFPSDWSLKNIPASNLSVTIKQPAPKAESAAKPNTSKKKEEEALAPELRTIESQINNSYGHQIYFGGTWLLYQSALKLGIIEDLMKVFGGDKEKVNRIFTLATYALMSRDDYDMVDLWQEENFLLTRYYMDYENVINILSSVTEENCEDFMRLRKERLPKGKVEYLCVQTNQYRKAIPEDVANEEPTESSNKLYQNIVFYAIPSHEDKVLNDFCFYPKTPFYLAQLPKNRKDYRENALQLLKVVDKAIPPSELNRVCIATDCAEETISDMDPILRKGLKVVSKVFPKQSDLIRIIKEEFSEYAPSRKEQSLFDPSQDEFYYQETTSHQLSEEEPDKEMDNGDDDQEGKKTTEIELKTTVRLSIPSQEDWINMVSDEIAQQSEKAKQAIGTQVPIEDREKFEKDFFHLEFEYDPQDDTIVDFHHNNAEIEREILIAGFEAFRSFGFEADAEEISNFDSELCIQEYNLRPFKKEFDLSDPTGKEEQAFTGIRMTTLIALILHAFLDDLRENNDLFKFGVEVDDLLDEANKVYACERNGKIYFGGKNLTRYKQCLEALGTELPKGVRLSSSTK